MAGSPALADWRQAFRAKGDRELPRRAVQRFGGRVFGRSQQAFRRADPMPVGPMPFRKGEHELSGFVEGFDCPAVGEDEGLRERTRPGHAFGLQFLAEPAA
jgi:hypothetical protein